ncbi:hypothetical protein JCM17845_15440 [Iodidimonas gelatinilytica]|uniref:Prohead serine protease domain-containing protein n=1 Tax=Iodidimonas gelatinilytica TaxID=1236966 RepID=A0A5A7MXX4_9PROT|nr:prohead protease/major capsid protein fusion protein [Iodidimonas gelatinilytica]GER00921.1 hypothetical protein JCM17845_15440 [Iodidimonas gelatinilytica]
MPQKTTTRPPKVESERQLSAPVIQRTAEVAPTTFNDEDLSFDVVWTTGATVRRFDWYHGEYVDETLSTDPAHVRLDRLNAGAPLLNTHAQHDLANVIGSIVPGSVELGDAGGTARVRLADTEDVTIIAAKVKAGHIRNISVGYVVHTFQETVGPGERRSLLAVDWEPWEVSLVPIPADPGAQIRGSAAASQVVPCTILSRSTDQPQMQKDDIAMSKKSGQTRSELEQVCAAQTPSAIPTSVPDTEQRSVESPRLTAEAVCVTVAAIRAACRNAGLDTDSTMDIIERHETSALDQTALMAEIGRRFAERDTPAQTVSRVSVTRDEAVTRRAAMTDAILCRMAPASNTITDAARDYRGMSLMRLAEETLVRENVQVRGMSAVELAERALHTTSDFPNILSNVLNKRLRQAYEESQPSYRLWARRAPNAPDFKPIDVVQMSAVPDLLRTNEAGEFKYGTASDGKISYSVLTYGRIIGVTRQTLVNDDLRALDRLTTGYAAAAARLENRTVYAQLAGSGTYGGSDLFKAGNGNLAASGAAINATTLGAGRAALRKQKGLQKEELNIAPRYLIVPTDLEQVAYQFTSSQFVPVKATDVNEFRAGGRTALEPIVEAVLDGHSATSWYLAADTGRWIPSNMPIWMVLKASNCPAALVSMWMVWSLRRRSILLPLPSITEGSGRIPEPDEGRLKINRDGSQRLLFLYPNLERRDEKFCAGGCQCDGDRPRRSDVRRRGAGGELVRRCHGRCCHGRRGGSGDTRGCGYHQGNGYIDSGSKGLLVCGQQARHEYRQRQYPDRGCDCGCDKR